MLDVWDRLAQLPPVASPVTARAAVLVPLYEDESGNSRLILTKRPDDMRTHPGDVVFPGGRLEGAETPVEAATREAWEEIRLPRESVSVLGGLSPVTTRSRTNVIVPVVARVDRPDELVADPREVDVILEPTLEELLREHHWHTNDFMGHQLWFYEFPEGILWGATAFMVRELLRYFR